MRDRKAAGRKAQSSGKAWERAIAAQNVAYQMEGKALVNHVEVGSRIVGGGKVLRLQSPPDFDGTFRCGDRFIPCRFEAKSFEGDRWSLQEWRPVGKRHKAHQLKALRDMARFGGLAFALVQQSKLKPTPGTGENYYNYPAWLVPLVFVETYILLGRWSVTAKELDEGCARIRGADWYSSAIDLTGLTPSAHGGRLIVNDRKHKGDRMTGVKQMEEAGDAIVIGAAGLIKKQGWAYFAAHIKAFYDGLANSQQIPVEFADLDPTKEAALAAHWTATMADHGIGSEHAEFLIGKIMNMLKDGWDIYKHFHETTVTA
jgi:hypothetical protein